MKSQNTLACLILLLGSTLRAETLTLEAALTRARERAPSIAASRFRVDEARARLLGASILLPENPAIEAQAGPRTSDAGNTTDIEIGASQAFDPPRRRRARTDAARAVVEQEIQLSANVVREVLREVGLSFSNASVATQRLEIARSNLRLAEETVRIAERRYSAGDIAQLDLNVSRANLVRARSELRAVEGQQLFALADLKTLLGIPPSQEISVSTHSAAVPDSTIEDLLRMARTRPDVQAIEAEIRQNEAEAKLARSLRWPDFGVSAAYRSEEGDRIATGGLRLTLPFFQRGQEAGAVAAARLNRLRIERDALIRMIEIDVTTAASAYRRLREAVTDLQRNALPLLEENEELALESYDAGQISLGELIQVRRESLETRRAYLEHLDQMQRTAIELQARAGRLQ